MEGTEGTAVGLCRLRPAGAHQAHLVSAGKTGRRDWKGSRMLCCGHVRTLCGIGGRGHLGTGAPVRRLCLNLIPQLGFSGRLLGSGKRRAVQQVLCKFG